MKMNILNLLNEEDAYLYGLLLTDGHCYLQSRNRGRISLELIDKDIIDKIDERYEGNTSSRTRDTNFKKNVSTFTWRNSKIEFRNELSTYGFPSGNKQYLQDVPKVDFNQKGFWRGVVDGNGSLGMTNYPFPFLSLTTKSESLKNSYLAFLSHNFEIKKFPKRNKRDSIYNICLYKEDAQNVSKFLYQKSKLFIRRKYDAYLLINQWVRPTDMKVRQWLSCHR